MKRLLLALPLLIMLGGCEVQDNGKGSTTYKFDKPVSIDELDKKVKEFNKGKQPKKIKKVIINKPNPSVVHTTPDKSTSVVKPKPIILPPKKPKPVVEPIGKAIKMNYQGEIQPCIDYFDELWCKKKSIGLGAGSVINVIKDKDGQPVVIDKRSE